MSESPRPDPQPPVSELAGARIGKYDVVKLLGKGAMGQVFLARDSMLEREVALKVMVSSIADDPDLMKRFEREAKAVARMSHPNVVNVFDLGYHTDGSPYMAMELLRGSDLQKAMRQTPPLTLERKVNVLVQVLTGLAHAHQAGIVHRDIKPANVFINHDGTVKIMDFGVARLTTASMTGTGAIVGTADYMSPEQVRGAKVDGRSDLFSVGCMFFELLSGRRPFRAENLMAVFYKITHDDPDFNMIPAGEDYDALLPILKKSLAKNLDDRYTTAYDFANDLRAFLKHRAAEAPADNVLEGLVDIEPPPASGPQALVDISELVGGSAEPTVVDAGTVPGASGRTSAAPTVRSAAAPTVVGPRPGTGRPSAPGKVGPAAARPAPAARPVPPPPATSPLIYVAVVAAALGLAGVSYLLWKQMSPAPTAAPPPTVATAPVTTAPAASTLATPPPTAAPPPTFVEAQGKGAAAMRAAQAAFRQGDYGRAVTQAQNALREDPGNADAQRLLENAMTGQKAKALFDGAEDALKKGDFTKAQADAEAGRKVASWDAQGPDLLNRIQQAQRVAQERAAGDERRRVEAELQGLLGQAEQALGAQKYDQAVALYDQALAKDPVNQRAALGKTSALAARAVATAAAGAAAQPAAPAGKKFAVGRTEAKGAEPAGGSVPPGFEETPGVAAKSATQAADLPGKLSFEIEPALAKAGERYTVKIYLLNEGTAPIQIQSMQITNTVNGRSSKAPVPPQAKEIAPAQRALLLSTSDVWKEDTTSWSMEVLVRTARSETYRNKVEWK
jgi:eukaryotic-like serine/threonine-protein kinase